MNSHQEIHYPFHFLHDKLISSLLSHLASRKGCADVSLVDLFLLGFGYGSWMFPIGGCGDYREGVMFVRKIFGSEGFRRPVWWLMPMVLPEAGCSLVSEGSTENNHCLQRS